MTSTDSTTFLNVDLDVASAGELAPLVAALEPHALLLGDRPTDTGARLVSFELDAPPPDANATLERFVALLAELPRDARQAWELAESRRFDIGIQSGRAGPTFHCDLSPAVLQAIAVLGATITFTVYPPEDAATDAAAPEPPEPHLRATERGP